MKSAAMRTSLLSLLAVLSLAASAAAHVPRRRARYSQKPRYSLTKPPVTATERITQATVGAYALQVAKPELASWGARVTPLVLRGQWWRLATPMFLHGSPMHLLVNVMALKNVGGALERAYGRKKTALVYAVAGVGGNLFACAVEGARSRVVSVGASGAVAGLVGALAARRRVERRVSTGPPRRASRRSPPQVHLYRHSALYGTDGLRSIGNTVLLNAALGATSGTTDNLAHLGGLLSGAAAGVLIGCRWRPRRDFTGKVVGFVDRPLIKV